MQTLITLTLKPQKITGQAVSRIWPVWKDSARGHVPYEKITRKQAQKTWFKARNWDRRTRSAGKHGGILGRSALAVLYALVHDFLNYRTGRLDPSVRSIANAASVCERTAYTALKKLRSLGLLDWCRRCVQALDEEGRFFLQQSTNLYRLPSPSQWNGYRDEEPPLPTGDTLGKPEPLPTTIETASQEIATGNLLTAYRDLMSDQSDRLAVALAQFGRTLGRI